MLREKGKGCSGELTILCSKPIPSERRHPISADPCECSLEPTWHAGSCGWTRDELAESRGVETDHEFFALLLYRVIFDIVKTSRCSN